MDTGPVMAQCPDMDNCVTLPQPNTKSANGFTVQAMPSTSSNMAIPPPTQAPAKTHVSDHYTGIPGDGIVPG